MQVSEEEQLWVLRGWHNAYLRVEFQTAFKYKTSEAEHIHYPTQNAGNSYPAFLSSLSLSLILVIHWKLKNRDKMEKNHLS